MYCEEKKKWFCVQQSLLSCVDSLVFGDLIEPKCQLFPQRED